MFTRFSFFSSESIKSQSIQEDIEKLGWEFGVMVAGAAVALAGCCAFCCWIGTHCCARLAEEEVEEERLELGVTLVH